MNTLVNAVNELNLNEKTVTTNGMKARVSSANHNVDFFFKAAASRGSLDVVNQFISAYNEDAELAMRNLQWLRDVRGGAGERNSFRLILKHLESINSVYTKPLLRKIPEIGRWDDMLEVQLPSNWDYVVQLIKNGLDDPNTCGLVAKWLPREKSSKTGIARKLMNSLGLTPKQYRKLLSSSTSVVESQMCNKEWDLINFESVPSRAASIYSNAFKRNTPKYAEYVEKLANGNAKVNASAIFPHDVIKPLFNLKPKDSVTTNFITAQWNSLPDYMNDVKIIPVVDVSGSMDCPVGSGVPSQLTCMQVAISMGLYIADKSKGPFKDFFCTFHTSPSFQMLRGDIDSKVKQLQRADWGGSTNLEAVFKKLLELATHKKVKLEDMPDYVCILSDMQFNVASRHTDTAIKMITREYEKHGYKLPKVIFWNINAYDNVPVKFDKEGTCLVSGFSPSILKSVLSAKFDDVEPITPIQVMLDTLMNERYDI